MVLFHALGASRSHLGREGITSPRKEILLETRLNGFHPPRARVLTTTVSSRNVRSPPCGPHPKDKLKKDQQKKSPESSS